MNAKAVVTVLLVLAAAGTFWAFRHREAEGLVLSGTIEARDVEVGSLTGAGWPPCTPTKAPRSRRASRW